MSAEAVGEGGSNPESLRGNGLDCFVASAPRNDECGATACPDFPRYYPLITPLATSLFQMNSTTTAPIVAMMKPAPWSGP